MKQLHSFDELRQIKDTKVYALGTFALSLPLNIIR